MDISNRIRAWLVSRGLAPSGQTGLGLGTNFDLETLPWVRRAGSGGVGGCSGGYGCCGGSRGLPEVSRKATGSHLQPTECELAQVHPWSIKVLCKSGEHICTKCCKEDSWECSACRALAAAPLPPRPDFPWHIWSVPNESPPPLPRETHVPGRTEARASALGRIFGPPKISWDASSGARG